MAVQRLSEARESWVSYGSSEIKWSTQMLIALAYSKIASVAMLQELIEMCRPRMPPWISMWLQTSVRFEILQNKVWILRLIFFYCFVLMHLSFLCICHPNSLILLLKVCVCVCGIGEREGTGETGGWGKERNGGACVSACISTINWKYLYIFGQNWSNPFFYFNLLFEFFF